ncbi:MAG TPA: hypothetical protein VM347_26830 [Nonomuraea sp.]|nr:hypothetical protein [Nonomuraea sp.]
MPCTPSPPPAPPQRLLTLRAWCGQYLTDLADLTRAILLLKDILAERERVLGGDHPITKAVRGNLDSAGG